MPRARTNPMNNLGRLSNEQALDLFRQGAAIGDVAEAAGVSRGRVYAWRKVHGIARPYRRFPIGPVDRRTYQREWSRQRRRKGAA